MKNLFMSSATKYFLELIRPRSEEALSQRKLVSRGPYKRPGEGKLNIQTHDLPWLGEVTLV